MTELTLEVIDLPQGPVPYFKAGDGTISMRLARLHNETQTMNAVLFSKMSVPFDFSTRGQDTLAILAEKAEDLDMMIKNLITIRNQIKEQEHLR